MGTTDPRERADSGEARRGARFCASAVGATAGVPPDVVVPGAPCTGTAEAPSPARHGLIRHHWEGRYALGRAFWGNLGIGALLLLGLWVLLILREGDLSARALAAGALALTLVDVLFGVWWARGTWRSATRQIARRKRHGRLAKLLVAALSVYQAVVLIQSRSDLAEYWPVMLGEQPGPEPLVRVRPDGASVIVAGGFRDGTALALRRALDDAPQVATVVLDSEGGWLHEGEAIARIITERHLGTAVQGECSSACTLAFLAGTTRTLTVGARIGFHRVRRVLRIAAEDAESTSEIYQTAQLPKHFIARVVSTPPTEMWYPSLRELLQAQVVTATHEWDDAWDDLMASTRASLQEELADVRLPATAFEKIVECQVSEHIRWLNATGCAYHFDDAEISRVEHLRQQDACVSGAPGADTRERQIALPCMRAHVPNDWSIFQGVFERSFAAEIALRKPRTDDAARVGACAAAIFAAALNQTPCKPLNVDAQSVAALFHGDDACLTQHASVRKRALSEAFARCAAEAKGEGRPPGLPVLAARRAGGAAEL